MILHVNCKGCRTYIPKGERSRNNFYAKEKHRPVLINSCDYMNFNANGECPCTVCVIKMMCDKPCGPFDAFTELCAMKDKELDDV